MRKRAARNGRQVLPKVVVTNPPRVVVPSAAPRPDMEGVGTFPRTRIIVVPASPKRARAAQRALQKALAEKQQKKISDAKQVKQDPVVKGKRHVSLSQAAMKRLQGNAAFQVSPTVAPKQVSSTTVPAQRAGFAMPTASRKIVWRDESEDASMWDR